MAALAAAAWLVVAWQPAHDHRAPPVVLLGPAAPASASAVHARSSPPVEGLRGPRSAASATVPVSAERAPESAGCFGGPVGSANGRAAQGLEARSEGLARWVGAMQASADDRIRAAGWLIGMPVAGAADRDRLAILAASSTDPVVQAYAQRACRSDPASSSACLALRPDAWAGLEPDNAAAWLALAADPRAELAQQHDALRQAAVAARFDSHMVLLHALAHAAQPDGIDAGDQLAMAGEVRAARGDWLATEALRQHCHGPAMAEADLQPSCSAIAELLQAKAQTLPDLQQAHELGRSLGWEAPKLDALRDEAAGLAAAMRRVGEADDPGDCAAAARTIDFFVDAGRVGDVEALRNRMDGGARR